MKNIVLIGMSGCGKTTVGKLLAQRLGMPFVDVDDFIQQRQGATVKQIFDRHGEAYFRSLEGKACNELASKPNTVISTGGGAVTSEATMQCFANSTVVYIKRDINRIISTADASVRPLFTDADAVKRLYERRKTLYQKYACFTVENISVEQCVQEIINLITQ